MSQDEIIEKIKKAMRLARKAGTDGERIAAENAAKRLAANNGIAFDEVAASCDDTERVSKSVEVEQGDDKWTAQTGVEVGFAFATLREHFAVIGMTISRGTGSRRRYKYSFFGNALNIEVAKYAFEIMLRESRKAWREVKKWRGGSDGINHTAFMRGWFCNINEKLWANPIRNDKAQLEAEKEQNEKEYQKFKEEQGNIKTARKRTMKNSDDYESTCAGYEAAEKVSLNRPCTGTQVVAPHLTQTVMLERRAS